VLNANASAGPDTILFDSSVTGTILLTSGALTVTDPLTLEGPGRDLLTLDGAAVPAILQVEDSLSLAHLKLVNAGGNAIDAAMTKPQTTITLRASTIEGSAGSGLAARVNAGYRDDDAPVLIIENSIITGNSNKGIGVVADYPFYSNFSMTVSGSTIADNGDTGIDLIVERGPYWLVTDALVAATIEGSTISRNNGNGIWVDNGNGDVQVINSKVSDNTGVGVSAIAGPWWGSFRDLSIADSLIAGNGDNGVQTFDLTMSNSKVSNNEGDGVRAGNLDLQDSTVSDNRGIGIKNKNSYYVSTVARLDGCTISGNQSGGVMSYDYSSSADISLQVSNCTISNNRSPADGAGIWVSMEYERSSPPIRISNSTITGNIADGSGGGIYLYSYYGHDQDGADLVVKNSIVAGNAATTDPDVATMAYFEADYSLIRDLGATVMTETVPGSNIVGADPLLDSATDNGGPTQTHGLLPGSPALDRGDPNFTPPPDFDQRGEGFDRVVNGRIDIGAVEMQAGTSQPAGAWLRSIGDTNGDGTPEIAVVTRVDGANRATVKDAANGALISRFAFNAALRPVDVETMPVFGQGLTPHLVLLGAAPAQAETRDALTGSLVGTVTFNPSAIPVDLTVLPDQDGNGNPELGMLTQDSTTVEVRDATNGTLFNTLSFAAQLDPRQVLTLPDLNRNGSAEVGVVLSDDSKADRVVIKDTRTGAAIQTLWSGADLLQAAPVADRNRNGAPEVALLWRNPGAGATQVWVVDAATNRRLASLAVFNQSVTPLKLAVVADVTGNRVEEYAVLGRTTETGQATVTVLDGATGQRVSRMWYDPGCTPLDLVSIADLNGNGAAELVMLGRCGPDGELRAFVKDAKTTQALNRLNF
jgi:hypothetical protein